jgi:tetratricopeptide (TPR) repeat protein
MPDMKLTDKDSCIREGNRMLDAGNYAAAEKAFIKAAEFDLKDPETMNLLGKAYYGKREYGKAILAYKSAVAKKSNFADAYYNLGDVYLAQGKPDEAMTQYKAAIRLNPAYVRRTRNFY